MNSLNSDLDTFQVWNICKYALAIVCGFIAYASLVPAVFWSLLYKIYGFVTEDEE